MKKFNEILKEAKKFKISDKDPATLTAKQVNTELDKIKKRESEITHELISLGRGSEKHSDIVKKDDPLSKEYKDLSDRRNKLYLEIKIRVGSIGGYSMPIERGKFGPRIKK